MQGLRYVLAAMGILAVSTLALAQVRGVSEEAQTSDVPARAVPDRPVPPPPVAGGPLEPPVDLPVATPPMAVPDEPPRGGFAPPGRSVPGYRGTGRPGRVTPVRPGIPPTRVIARPGETRFAMSLKDGSRLVGKPVGMTNVGVTTSFGKTSIPLQQITSITSHAGSTRVKIRFRNGDLLSGAMQSQSIRFKTEYGEIKVPVAAVISMQLGSSFTTGNGPTTPSRVSRRPGRRPRVGYGSSSSGSAPGPGVAPNGATRSVPATTTGRTIIIRDASIAEDVEEIRRR